MASIFTNSRIKFNELLNDAKKYLSSVYGQSDETFTPASPFGQILTVIVGLAEKIFYYIEDSVTELNLSTASRESSYRGLVTLTGYQPNNAKSAKGNVNITYNGNKFDDLSVTQVILPNYSKIYSKYNNLPYLIEMQNEARFDVTTGSKTITAKIVQGELIERVFTATGRNVQTYRINDKSPDYIDLESVRIFVNNVEFDRDHSIYDMPLGVGRYMVRTSVGGGLDIVFGTYKNGINPPAGSIIRFEAVKTIGFLGNILESKNVKFDYVDPGFDNFGNDIDLNEYLDITPTTEIVFGSNPESIDITKIAAPKTSRAFVLGTLASYDTYIRRMNYFSTVDVFNTFDDDNINDDNVVYMFLIPNLQYRIDPKYNYFSAPITAFLMSNDEETMFLEQIEASGQMLIGTELDIINPTIKRFTLHVFIDYFTGYSKELIRTNIIDSLSTYFITYTRRDRVPRSDLIAIIEGINGVDSVNVFFKADPNNATSENETIINEMGDIIIGNRDYPIIRGGWVDGDTNVQYLEDINESHPSSLNITFQRVVDKDTNRANNKSVVRNIRNRNI